MNRRYEAVAAFRFAVAVLLCVHLLPVVRAQTDPVTVTEEAAATTGSVLGQPTAADILPTSGTTDPVILASIAPPEAVEAASLDATPQATVMPLSADELATAAGGADTPATEGIVGTPKSFTRRQYALALAAIRRADAAAAAAPAAAGQVTVQSVGGMLAQHNTYRATHNATAMTWDTTVTTSAQSWANQCRFQHQGNTGYGENLYLASGQDVNAAAAAATKAWYDEVKNYNYASPNMATFSTWGHFSQVVWRSSTQLGCAAKFCSNLMSSWGGGVIVVCRYSPPGNVAGQYTTNVLPPGGTPPPVAETTLQQNYFFSSGTATTGFGGCLNSQNGVYKLCMRPDANLVLYNRAWAAIWASNTANRATSRPFGAWLRSSGQLSLFDSRQTSGVYWTNIGTASSVTPHRLVLQNDGNVVIYNGQNRAIWATNTVGR